MSNIDTHIHVANTVMGMSFNYGQKTLTTGCGKRRDHISDAEGCLQTAVKGTEGFYVSVGDGNQSGLLLGPYATKTDAESDVDTGKTLAEQVNSRAIWYAYGVTRVVMQPGAALPKGKLNEYAAQAARKAAS